MAPEWRVYGDRNFERSGEKAETREEETSEETNENAVKLAFCCPQSSDAIVRSRAQKRACWREIDRTGQTREYEE
jgi:hypothetical protein